MTTLRVVKDEDEKRYGEYRTKRVILEIYDKMKQAIETGSRIERDWSHHLPIHRWPTHRVWG